MPISPRPAAGEHRCDAIADRPGKPGGQCRGGHRRWRPHPDRHALEHRLDPDADTTLQRGYVTLSVCDEGHGMAPTSRGPASPSSPPRTSARAAAWALSQVFGFTTQSGGFDVSTTPVSALVSLLLPQQRMQPMTDEPIRVLMVEDQNDLREMIGMALRDFGIEVSTTADGHEAAALLKATHASTWCSAMSACPTACPVSS